MSRARKIVEAAINSIECDAFIEKNNSSNLKNRSRGHSEEIRISNEVPKADVTAYHDESLVGLHSSENEAVLSDSSDVIPPSDCGETSYSILKDICFLRSRRTHSSPMRQIHNLDIIEDSEAESSYATLEVTRANNNIVDYSSDSGELYVPESSDSESSVESSSLLTHVEEVVQNNNSGTHEHFPVNELGVESTSRKRKIFPKKENMSKKRPRNVATWKTKSAAFAREKGEEYRSYKNTIVPKKTICESLLCRENCRYGCSEKINIEQRKTLLKDFYSLDVNSKNALLFKSIVRTNVARVRANARKHKSSSYKYYVTLNGSSVQVCKLGLCALYQIGIKKVDVIISRIKSGASAPPADRRGKHNNRPMKMGDDVIDRVKKHISSFPAEQSHYSRSKNMYKMYLSPLLNVTKMHELYLEMCNEESLPDSFKIKKTSYNKIFVTQFNLSFGYPKSDTCSTCDAGGKTDEHVANYHDAVEAMRRDRKIPAENDNVLYITVDLQQTMPLPKIPTSKAFYLRQIWFYNLGIHVVNGKKERAVCCTWTENVADRGSCEVASALLRFVEVDSACRNKERLIVWSDSCAGQNKNFNMIALYQYMIRQGHLKVIDHKFPEVGHSFLDSDRDFGRIEKVLRKHETVYEPDQYRNIICKASRNNTVIDMSGHFRKINDIASKLKLLNRKTDENKGKVNFRDAVKWIRVEEYGSYLFKECYDEMTPFKKVNILKKHGSPDSFEVERVEGNYGTITKEKRDNIREQLKFVKPEHRYFYDSILNS